MLHHRIDNTGATAKPQWHHTVVFPVDVTAAFIQHCRDHVLEFTVMGTPSGRKPPATVKGPGISVSWEGSRIVNMSSIKDLHMDANNLKDEEARQEVQVSGTCKPVKLIIGAWCALHPRRHPLC